MKTHYRLNIIVALLTVIAYASVHISPEQFWVAGFLAYATPVLLLCNAFYVIYWWVRKKRKRIFWSVLVFVMGWSQVNRSISFDFSDETENPSIGVLSANVRIFNFYDHLKKDDPESSDKYIKWLESNPNDILCLQEYYEDNKNAVYKTSQRLKKTFPHYFVQTAATNRIKAKFGVAIFSKHRILYHGMIPFKEKSKNQAVYADIIWNNDTIRVYNIHLESMHIEEDKLFDGKNSSDDLSSKSKETFKRLRQGFITRAKQINVILEEMSRCPYPKIICGDLNDLPYSYTYQQLKNEFNNSFEEKGFGIGTTYNGKLPFLRIDNQFFSDEFQINRFTIYDEIDFSDHYPIGGSYELISDGE